MYKIPLHAIASEADKIVEWERAEYAYSHSHMLMMNPYAKAFPPDGMWPRRKLTAERAVEMTRLGTSLSDSINTQVHILGER